MVIGVVFVVPDASAARTAPPLTDSSGVALGITPPVVATAPPGPHAVLALGDSDLAQGVFALPELLTTYGFDVPVYDAHGNGWGLLDPLDGATAREVLARQLDAHPDVDTVVIGFVGVCAVACGPGKLAYGSRGFYDAWDAAARALVVAARARGKQVVWAVSPPAAPAPDDARPVQEWSSLAMRHRVAVELQARARRYARRFRIASADMSQALSDTSGGWQRRLAYDGAVHQVRLEDGVHLTEDGARRASEWVMATLAQLWSRPEVGSGA